MNPVAIAVIGGLCGMFGWGFADFFAKKTIDRAGSIKSLVWAHLFGTLFFVVIAFCQKLFFGNGLQLPSSSSTWLGLAFFGVLQMIVYWLVYEGFGRGLLAVLNPIFASYAGLVALASVLFFGEALHVLLGLGLLVIFGGVLLINLDFTSLTKKRLKVGDGVWYVAAAAILATIWTIYWDKFVGSHDPLTYALCMYIFMSLASIVLAYVMKVKVGGLPKDLLKYVVLIGLGETIAYLGISWAYSSTTYTGMIALISGSFSLPTLVLSHVYLKEKVTRTQTLAAFIIIVGIVLVALV